jgi:hypothetical protein
MLVLYHASHHLPCCCSHRCKICHQPYEALLQLDRVHLEQRLTPAAAAATGDKVCERPFETLLEAAWLAPPPGTSYEDRPASPERLSAASKGSGAAAGGSGAAASGAAQSKPAAYRLVRKRGYACCAAL